MRDDRARPAVAACPEQRPKEVAPVFYQIDWPTKNALERKWVDSAREKLDQLTDLQLRKRHSIR